MTGHVRFDDVSFGYDVISPVLRHVDLEARPGEVVALLGQTGSGKTTVVNLMPRFYDVTGGAITIDGVDIRDATLASLRRTFGIVQQDVFLFSATIRENIAYGASDASDEDVEHVAKLARIHDFIRRCRTATTRGSASAASRCPAARSSASRSRARSCWIRRSSSSTTRHPAWTRRPST